MLFLAAYKGKSWISKIIIGTNRFFRFISGRPGGIYSHNSIVTDKGIEYEAWHISDRTRWYRPFAGCFQKVKFGQNHKIGTEVDLFILPLTKKQEKMAIAILEKWVKDRIPYDYEGCINFAIRNKKGDLTKMFCSESFIALCFKIGFAIFRKVNPWLVDPTWSTRSSQLQFFGKIKTYKDCYKLFDKFNKKQD